MPDPSIVSLTSSIKNDQTLPPYKPLAAHTLQIGHDSAATAYPMANVDDKITTRYDSRSKQTKQVGNRKADITPTSTHFAPTSPIPVDACDTQYLEVTSTPVHVMAYTRYNGSLHVTAPNNYSAISVNLIHSNLNNISTYLYIEYLGHLPQNCTDRYIVLTTNHTPCAAIISGNQFRFHFQNSDIGLLVEVQISHIQISTCFYSQRAASWPLKCELKSYAKRIQQKIEYKDLSHDWGIVEATRYLADCKCDCPSCVP